MSGLPPDETPASAADPSRALTGRQPNGRAIAVIDVGSNSLRMMIARPREQGYLEIVAEPRAVLRLARVVDEHGGLPPAALARTLAVLDDFMTLAKRQRVDEVSAVGTSALRDAANAAALSAAMRERWGLELEVLAGDAEGRSAALGAIYGLPVHEGLVVDLGGGSLQIARFEQRAVTATWSFPLGTLRMTDRFLASDPPDKAELQTLRHHVRAELVSAGVPRLPPGEALVGTGGTVRNLAAVSRRGRRYPITRVHGLTVGGRRLRRVRDRLARMNAAERASVPGLNSDRADIIVAGAGALAATLEHVRAPALLVSGQGLREGVARGDGPLPPPATVRRASVAALARRFVSWDEARARRRAAIAATLCALLDPDAADDLRETLQHAALLLDVGSAIDVYRRGRASAEVVLRADLSGFAHGDVAWLAGVIRVSHRPAIEARVLRPLLGPDDDEALQRAGAILALADELELRLPPGDTPQSQLALEDGVVQVTLPNRAGWRPEALASRIERVFGHTLAIERGTG